MSIRRAIVLLLSVVTPAISASSHADDGAPIRLSMQVGDGAELPFNIARSADRGGAQSVAVAAGGEWFALDIESADRTTLVATFPNYGSTLMLRRTFGTNDFAGAWLKLSAGGKTRSVPIVARGADAPYDSPDAFAGRWSVNFDSSDDLAVGVFEVGEYNSVSGTFLTTTGDYRFLTGGVRNGELTFSTFDGAHAFLFKAALQPDGSLAGDFWSGNWWHETWSAVRDDDAELPDAFAGTTWVDGESIDDLVFADTDGNPASLKAALDAQGGKLRVVEVFGTWCPNCADAARDLKTLEAKYKGRGLTVLGLAFEYTDDITRSAEQVRRYKSHHDIGWPVLIAGLSNKAEASKALPILDRIRTFPTLIFLDERNNPIAVHAGYTGPATGDAYDAMIAEFESIIEEHLE